MMITIKKFLTPAIQILLITLIASLNSFSQTTPHQSLLVLSKAEHTLAIVDASTLKVLGKVTVGEDPHEVIASADGKTAYVSIYGGGSLHTINVIVLTTQKRLDDIDTKPLFGPHGLVFVNNKLWFSAEGAKAVGSYNVLTHSIDWSMGTGQDRTHMIYVTGDAKKIYTTNVSSGTVSILQDTMMMPGKFAPPNNAPKGNMPPPPQGNMPPRHNWEQTLITVSEGAEGFDVTPDDAELWTAASGNGKIYIIDLTSKKLAATIDAKVNGANRLKITPDGKLAFISSLGSGNVTVYDVKTRKPVKHINTGNGAAGILMQPDGSKVYVACTPDNYVAVIDLKTLEVINKINAGGQPDGLAWAQQ